MSDIAIRVEHLSKRYHIGASQAASADLRDTLGSIVFAPARRFYNLLRGDAYAAAELTEVLWALRDVSFEVKAGEALGIIGRNGAGKSTLLKVLARIAEPTQGRAEVYGRLAALLEVGTGFHQDLTGRENVYLNGAILGMSRAEVSARFDEIVAFAELEQFIDTPVKFYSSGMVTRLGFSVAAHLEPEILVVDEVLAVGDAAFQRRCLTKMENASYEGRTVLFVSHSLPAITRLCSRSIWLDKGQLIMDGASHEVLMRYLSASSGSVTERRWDNPDEAPGGRVARLRAVRIVKPEGDLEGAVDVRHRFGIQLEYDILEGGHIVYPNIYVLNEGGTYLFMAMDFHSEWGNKPRPTGRYVSTAWVPGNLLTECTLFVGVALTDFARRVVHFREPHAIMVQVVDKLEGDSARGTTGEMPGVIRPLLEWTNEFDPA